MVDICILYWLHEALPCRTGCAPWVSHSRTSGTASWYSGRWPGGGLARSAGHRSRCRTLGHLPCTAADDSCSAVRWLLVTLILAWYHGEKGRQRASGPELLLVAAILVAPGVAVSLLGESPPAQTVDPAHGNDTRPGIAVLPCDNISPDSEDAYYADGIHEEILLKLQASFWPTWAGTRKRSPSCGRRWRPIPSPPSSARISVTCCIAPGGTEKHWHNSKRPWSCTPILARRPPESQAPCSPWGGTTR